MSTTSGPRCTVCQSTLPEGNRICLVCAYKSALSSSVESVKFTDSATELSQWDFGELELIDELGRGGTGVVHLAWQASARRLVAAKVIAASLLGQAQVEEHFRESTLAAARLQHPSIIQTYAIGRFRGELWVLMEYVEDGDLGDFLKQGPIPPVTAAHLLRSIAEAIHYAHQEGVFHLDLKPQNILLDRNVPKVADFNHGAAAAGGWKQFTQGSVVSGSLRYMAPEQLAGDVQYIGPHTDVYGLGALLFAIVAGVPPPPPTGQSLPSGLLREVNPAVSPELEAVCLQCLHPDRTRRYQSARELASDLSRFLAGDRVHAASDRWLAGLFDWNRRHAGFWSTILMLALLAATSAAFFYHQRLQHVLAGHPESLPLSAEQLEKEMHLWAAPALFAFELFGASWLWFVTHSKRITWSQLSRHGPSAFSKTSFPAAPRVRRIFLATGVIAMIAMLLCWLRLLQLTAGYGFRPHLAVASLVVLFIGVAISYILLEALAVARRAERDWEASRSLTSLDELHSAASHSIPPHIRPPSRSGIARRELLFAQLGSAFWNRNPNRIDSTLLSLGSRLASRFTLLPGAAASATLALVAAISSWLAWRYLGHEIATLPILAVGLAAGGIHGAGLSAALRLRWLVARGQALANPAWKAALALVAINSLIPLAVTLPSPGAVIAVASMVWAVAALAGMLFFWLPYIFPRRTKSTE